MARDLAASVRAKLLNRSRETGESFNSLLIRFGIERLLYRLAQSAYAEEFILKGGNLFYVWTGQLTRPTKDLDMLRHGPTDPELMAGIITSCVTLDVEDDGLFFDAASIRAQVIRDHELYSGVRVTLKAYLKKAQIPLQLDVGTGDAVVPEAVEVEYPSLIEGMPSASLRAYRFETAIAEKCEAMATLGMANTRMKDFYDVHVLLNEHDFDGEQLVASVRATFERRGTPLPTRRPVAWTDAFGQDADKARQWGAFLRKNKLDAPTLDDVVERIASFVWPVFEAARGARTPGRWDAPSCSWGEP
jgi:predicted nucleotidyltransferase component of viral defense system